MIDGNSFTQVNLGLPLRPVKPIARIAYSARASFISPRAVICGGRTRQFFAKPEIAMSTEETRDGYVDHLEKALALTLDAQIECARAKHHLEKRHKARMLPAERRVSQLEDALRRSLTGILEARKTEESQL